MTRRETVEGSFTASDGEAFFREFFQHAYDSEKSGAASSVALLGPMGGVFRVAQERPGGAGYDANDLNLMANIQEAEIIELEWEKHRVWIEVIMPLKEALRKGSKSGKGQFSDKLKKKVREELARYTRLLAAYNDRVAQALKDMPSKGGDNQLKTSDGRLTFAPSEELEDLREAMRRLRNWLKGAEPLRQMLKQLVKLLGDTGQADRAVTTPETVTPYSDIPGKGSFGRGRGEVVGEPAFDSLERHIRGIGNLCGQAQDILHALDAIEELEGEDATLWRDRLRTAYTEKKTSIKMAWSTVNLTIRGWRNKHWVSDPDILKQSEELVSSRVRTNQALIKKYNDWITPKIVKETSAEKKKEKNK